MNNKHRDRTLVDGVVDPVLLSDRVKRLDDSSILVKAMSQAGAAEMFATIENHGDELFGFPVWQESMEEVERIIAGNDKRYSWRIFDRWTGQIEYRWAKQTSRAVKERYQPA